MLTNTALYNFKPGSYKTAKRKISLDLIESVHVNTENAHEFVVKVPSEYDYRFETEDSKMIVLSLQQAWNELQSWLHDDGAQLPVHNLESMYLQALLTTKQRKNALHLRARSSMSGSTRDSITSDDGSLDSLPGTDT